LHISNLYAGSYRFLLFDIIEYLLRFFLFYLIFNLSANSISGQIYSLRKWEENKIQPVVQDTKRKTLTLTNGVAEPGTAICENRMSDGVGGRPLN